VGTLLGSLDRQTALVEERMDAVKEYLLWREVPRELSVRVKRYYEHYYTQRAVFDETTILKGLNPSLQQSLVQHVCRTRMTGLDLT
jgi:hypothetical protein